MKTGITLCFIALCLSLGMNFYLYRQNRDLQENLKVASNETKADAQRPSSLLPEGSPPELTDEKIAAPEPEDQTESPDEEQKTPEPNPPPGGFAGEEMQNAFRDAMKNPAMRKMMQGQQKVAMEMAYNRLMGKLSLDEAETAHFLDLVVERNIGGMETFFELMGSGQTMDEDKRAELLGKLSASRNAAEEEISVFLNNEEDYKIYQDYTRKLGENTTVSMLQESLSSTDEPLGAEQADALVDMMFEERLKANYEVDFGDQYDVEPDKWTPENIEEYITKSAGVNTAISDRADEILDSAQLDAFRQSQQQMNQMAQMGLKMVSQMFGGQTAK